LLLEVYKIKTRISENIIFLFAQNALDVMPGSHLLTLIHLAVSSIYDILVVAARHRVNKSKTALTRKTSARVKMREKCVRAKY
jgi:hypothetical protein